ncbi:hypothetical protein [Paludisphaera mucosa]|uniref:Uncharacterized protein n=1 Tax=Paludisphaera mucosa TaxID=3030827 RepID=A0ABT6F9W5_9BACT|nr:hypothetical protein [Paludisphaera mucosa]MDG3004374.1 hypothetical protein [Paludisphaera mucosa]
MRTCILNGLSATVCAHAVLGYFLDQTWAADARPEDNLPGKVIHSWLANSFATEAGHQSVPVNVCGIGVTPDGTVYSAGVSEAFGGVASYKNGAFVTKYDYDSGWGSSSSAVVADDEFVYIGTGAGLFRSRIGDAAYNKTPILKGNFHGLAIRDDELYVSDYDAEKVRVLATATMKEVRTFAAPLPGPLAVGGDGRVWMIEGKPAKEPYASFYTGGAKIVSRTADGDKGPEIADFENPCALAVDAKGRLLVGGLNKHCQVWIYDVSEKPKKVDTFGAEGGIFSGTPGEYAPKKFHWVRGLGTDKAGNVYVASVYGTWYNVSIEAYDASGERLWDVHGLGNWLDTACTEPDDETTVYTKENVFRMDWTKAAGEEQSLAGFTVDRFKYPTDSRVTDGHGPGHRLVNGVRRIGGKPFLFCGAQGTGNLEIYRFGKGFVAAPCGYVGGASTWRPAGGKRWPEDAESFVWTDKNNDGVADVDEFDDAKKEPRWGSMHLDAEAGIWECADKTIWRIPCEGLDESGNPVYRRASEVSYENPNEFPPSRLRRVFYRPGEDTLIAGGAPGSDENVCNLFVCYDDWTDATKRKVRWSVKVPLDDKMYTPETSYGGGGVQAISACGEYLFAAYGFGYIRVHALKDGGYVGTLRPDINGFKGGGGCVDSDNALNVILRKNGEYVMFLENAGRNHVMMFRWTPPYEVKS